MGWISTNSPAPRLVSAWSPALIGSLAHELIQHLVVEECGTDAGSVRQAAGRVIPPGLARIHRLMVEQRICQAALVWLDLFDPRPAWSPVGVEVFVGERRVDLLWQSLGGVVWADELKVGRIRAGAVGQAEHIHQLGKGVFGATWGGVRLISLSPAPTLTTIAARAGAT